MSREQPPTEQASDLRLPAIGEVVAERYRIDELLGEGGMGAVFRALDMQADEAVAIKILLPQEADSSDSVKRFTREARAARAIASEHVATVREVGKLDRGLPYIVLELLVGQPFDRVISDHAPLPIADAVDYLMQACEGIAQAHALGIIHRDLKPANLYLYRRSDGSQVVKVLDFGIAKTTLRLDPNTDGISLTETSSTLGSPQYMSPEQLRSSKHVDVRTDIWALGLILFKLLTGHAAFEADTVGQHFAMILSEAPTPLRTYRPEAPIGLEAVIVCCLEKQPPDRFQDVAQLAAALAEFGPAGAAERVSRIHRILEQAGAASEKGPRPLTRPAIEEASTVADVTRRVSVEADGSTARAWDTSAGAPRPRSRHTAWIMTGATLALLVGGAGGYAWLGARGRTAGTASAPIAPGERGMAGEEERSIFGKRGAVSADAVGIVAFRLVLEPADAQVLVDGQPAAANPLVLPRDSAAHEITVRAAGYEPETRTVRAERDEELRFSLRRAGTASTASAKGPGGKTLATSGSSSPAAGATGTSPASGQAAAPTPTVRPKGPLEDTL